jgi:hypothetical protein
MSLHCEDPLIGSLDSKVYKREKLHHYRSREVAFGAIRATSCPARGRPARLPPANRYQHRARPAVDVREPPGNAARWPAAGDGLGITSATWSCPHPGNHGYLTGHAAQRQPAQHQLSRIITGHRLSRPLCNTLLFMALQAGQQNHETCDANFIASVAFGGGRDHFLIRVILAGFE